MEKIDSAEITIQSSIQECDSHVNRIRKVLNNINIHKPVLEKEIKNDENDIVAKIDQLIYRFTKLQDSMGTRLYPSLYTILEGNNKIIPFLDILNRLEKLGVITSVSDWQFFRNLRNNLAHDYPDSLGKTVETINLLISEIEKLIDMFNHAKNYYIERS
ncbi:hypothetical protein EW093_13395 [Thiospirochaeta perfilievii]|uniref:Toxin-antitoxin system antitoxin subunit n=1 Tax=Thiospirochaeta perfilievii TaxID=252967 RepID=A0A5C1QGD0_9SPIO|nr:hypothetical protein [Thiospirochaeta perfilievii]QEN05664.1 hypothetical protein EW093_13395 [Thiospirochaeta perfilievii]